MGRWPWQKHQAAVSHVAPRWRERHRRERLEQRESGRMPQEEVALLEALEAAGVRTEDFGLFASRVETTFDYDLAVPVLIEWLPRVRDPFLKEVIVRSLTGEPAAEGAGSRALVDEFRQTPSTDGKWSSVKWAIGDALATLADASVADDLLDLVRDKSHGSARERLCDALARTKDPRAPDALIEALDDPDLAGHAISALRRLGPKSSLPHLERARPKLERLVDDPSATPFARKQAAAALERLAR
jgi:HEAT repeat protein